MRDHLSSNNYKKFLYFFDLQKKKKLLIIIGRKMIPHLKKDEYEPKKIEPSSS